MDKQLYKQVSMERAIENGKVTSVAWIPSQLAKVGKRLSIKQKDDSWEDGWVVMSAGGVAMPFDHLDRHRDAQKRFERVLNRSVRE